MERLSREPVAADSNSGPRRDVRKKVRFHYEIRFFTRQETLIRPEHSGERIRVHCQLENDDLPSLLTLGILQVSTMTVHVEVIPKKEVTR